MFSQDPNAVPKKEELKLNAFQTWYKKFSSQPHQPFFTNGIIFFMLFLFLLFLSFSGKIAVNSSILDYHGFTMIHVVFIQFFLGFLFVVFPRFLMQAEIEPKVYMQHFFLYFASSIGIFVSLLISSKALFSIFVFVLFLAQIYSFKSLYEIHKKSLMKDKNDTKWVLIFYSTGILSYLMFIFSLIDTPISYALKQLSINAGFYLFLFGIVFTVSQRMIPFFTSMKVQGYTINKSKKLLEFVFALLVLKVILLSFDDARFNLLADIPLFILFMRELFIKWKLPAFKTVAIMWVLYLSLYWIPFAFFISILESLNALFNLGFIFEKVVIHTIALGYFVTVLIGFGTRVVLGHSGRTPHADKFAITIFIAVQIIAFLRIFTSFASNFNMDYLFFINLSSLLLIAGLIIWSFRYLKILIQGT